MHIRRAGHSTGSGRSLMVLVGLLRDRAAAGAVNHLFLGIGVTSNTTGSNSYSRESEPSKCDESLESFWELHVG